MIDPVIGFLVFITLLGALLGVLMARPLFRSGQRRLAFAVGAAAPVLALAVYLFDVGRPDLATFDRTVTADPQRAQMEAALAELRKQAKAAPDDAEVWSQLASAELVADHYAEAAAALDRLIDLSPDDPSLQSAYGEALVAAHGGVVTEEAQRALEAAYAADPEDVRAAFYLGEARFQAGKPDEAIARWTAIAEAAPSGAPYLATIARRLMRVAQMQERSIDSLGMKPETVAALESALDAPARPGPSEADMAAAQNMTPEQQAAFIDSMVARLTARLEANPDDLDGWRMAARSYQQLGRAEDWLHALEQVRRLAPGDLEAERDYAYALWLAGSDSAAPNPDAVAALEGLLERDPKDPVALLGLADSATKAGDPEKARTLLTRLVEDPGAPPVLVEEGRRQLGKLEQEGAAAPAP